MSPIIYGGSPGGGSSVFTQTRLPIAFNTPGIFAGITVVTLNPGDYISADVSASTAWNGASPTAYVGLGDPSLQDSISSVPIDFADAPLLNSTDIVKTQGLGPWFGQAVFRCVVACTINVAIRQSDGISAPGSTQGVGQVVALVLSAP